MGICSHLKWRLQSNPEEKESKIRDEISSKEEDREDLVLIWWNWFHTHYGNKFLQKSVFKVHCRWMKTSQTLLTRLTNSSSNFYHEFRMFVSEMVMSYVEGVWDTGLFPNCCQRCVISRYCTWFVCCVLTSSQVSGGSQIGEVIQADDVNDGADHSRMVLHGRRRTRRHITIETWLNIWNVCLPYTRRLGKDFEKTKVWVKWSSWCQL